MPWQFSTLSPSAAQATPRTSAWSGVVRACDVGRHGPSTPQHVKSHRTEVLQFRFGDCGSLQTNAIFHIISNKNCWGRIYCHNHSRQNLTLNSALQYLFCLSAHSSSFPFSRHQTAPVEHHYHQEKGPKFALAERAEGLQYLPRQIKEDEWRPTQSHTSSWWPRSRPMTLKPRCILVASNPHIPEGEGQQLTLAQHLSTQAHQQLLDKGAHLSLTRQ